MSHVVFTLENTVRDSLSQCILKDEAWSIYFPHGVLVNSGPTVFQLRIILTVPHMRVAVSL